MLTAMDCLPNTRLRPVVFAAVFLATAAHAGCARLQSTRQPSNKPVEFGTDFPPVNDTRPGFSDRTPKSSNTAPLADKSDPAPAGETVRSTAHPEVLAAEPAGAATNPPAEPAQPAPDTAKPATSALIDVIADSRRALSGLSHYQVVMNRQERVAGAVNPAEDVVLSVRRSPKAVRLEWRDGPHKGREVIYVADSGPGKGVMKVHMGDSPLPVPDLTMAPDSPLALAKSRHPIDEAGFDTIVDKLQSVIDQNRARADSGDGAKLSYEGKDQPADLEKPCHKILRVTPQGERWVVYIDPDNHLPALVEGTAADGSLLERYVFCSPKTDCPDLAKADAFDPVARWGEQKGFFQKLARAAATVTEPPSSP